MQFPLVPRDALARVCVRSDSTRLGYSQILHKATLLAECLPDVRYCMVLCERRDLFVISYIAVLMRKQTLLLPSNRTEGVLRDVLDEYPDSCCVVDDGVVPLGLPSLDCTWLDEETGESSHIPVLAAEHVAAIVFTSGTTGKPAPNIKCWGDLVLGSRLLQQRLGLDHGVAIVATVPPQHMYGLETSVMAPLMLGGSVYAGRPFYPADLQAALTAMDVPPVLVTTPLHLRAVTSAELQWPRLQRVISATAPLDQKLAEKVEQILKTSVTEIFGCTEAGSFASRETARDIDWHMYGGTRIEQQGEEAVIRGQHLPQPVLLSDRLQVHNPDCFRFLGRQSDMIKIAGKRVSLSELNIRLNGIPGVEDGVFVMRKQSHAQVNRLLALVVAPELSASQLRETLAVSIDPVFLPRPLLKVDSLPRNHANKLPQQEMDALLSELGY